MLPKRRSPKREPGAPPSVTDEYRTPQIIGEAMAAATNLPRFDLDPFAPVRGYSGIPARRAVHWKQDIYATDVGEVSSIGFNVPFSEHGKALARIAEIVGDRDIPIVGIVRADTSVRWWTEHVVESGLYSWVVFTPRIQFSDAEGEQTTGSPGGGVAIIGNVNTFATCVHTAVSERYGSAWTVRI